MHNLYSVNPLIPHLARMMDTLSTYDFRWLRNTNPTWATQTTIPTERRKAMMACLFHYNMDVSLLMRFLGGNYTGAYRDAHATARYLIRHGISEALVQHYSRVMTVGCPHIMNATISRQNVL